MPRGRVHPTYGYAGFARSIACACDEAVARWAAAVATRVAHR
jgi:hypothetical protein